MTTFPGDPPVGPTELPETTWAITGAAASYGCVSMPGPEATRPEICRGKWLFREIACALALVPQITSGPVLDELLRSIEKLR
jgi:hypothetical protein